MKLQSSYKIAVLKFNVKILCHFFTPLPQLCFIICIFNRMHKRFISPTGRSSQS